MNNNKLHEDIGHIKGILEGVKYELTKINGCVQDNDRRLNDHDKLMARAIGYIFGLGTLAGIISNVLLSWLKSKF